MHQLMLPCRNALNTHVHILKCRKSAVTEVKMPEVSTKQEVEFR